MQATEVSRTTQNPEQGLQAGAQTAGVSPMKVELVLPQRVEKPKADKTKPKSSDATLRAIGVMLTVGALSTLANGKKLIYDSLGSEFVFRYVNDIPKIVPLSKNITGQAVVNGCIDMGKYAGAGAAFAGKYVAGVTGSVLGGLAGAIGGCAIGAIKGVSNAYFAIENYAIENPFWRNFDVRWLKRAGFDLQSELIPGSVMPAKIHGFVAEMVYQIAENVISNPEMYIKPVTGIDIAQAISGVALIALGVKKGLKSKQGFISALAGTLCLAGVSVNVIKFENVPIDFSALSQYSPSAVLDLARSAHRNLIQGPGEYLSNIMMM